MPDEITQRLGFDASSAIASLRKLQVQLREFREGLQATSGTLRKFPSIAQGTVKSLREIATAARQAKIELQSIGQITGISSTLPAQAQAANQAMGNLGTTVVSTGQSFTEYSSGATQGAQAVGQLSESAKSAASGVSSAANKTASAAGKIGNSLEEAGKKGDAAAKIITLSWKTVFRVIQAQLIVRALSKIINIFGEAHEKAKEFSVAIAEVATISSDALGDLDSIGDSVLELSSALGIAADEVAEGLYQTLSNQVVDAGDALRFEEAAARLSIATHSELKESVNALSSVMNSYGLEVAEIDNVANILFKTIELGRLRMGEFGDVLGRVSPLTAALGIEYQEMAGAIAAITQKGVPAHTAITQLTQVSQKLLRPTEKLQELYHKWGVESGPEAIRRFGGLAGVLLKMKDASAGSDAAFADLLGRVRAIVGALNLTSEEGSALSKIMKEMEEDTNAAAEAFAKVEESAGRKAIKSWNELSVEVIKFGQILLEVSTPLAKTLKFLVDNIEYIAAAFGTATAAALVLTGVIPSLTLSLGSLAVAAGALGTALTTIWPILLAVGAAFAAVQIGKWVAEWINGTDELQKTHKAALEEINKQHEEAAQARIEKTKKEFEERRKITSEGFSAMTRDYQKMIEVMDAKSEQITEILSDNLKDLMGERTKYIDEITKATKEADDAIKDSMEEIADTQEKIAEAAFTRETRHMNARQQLFAELERASDTAGDAREMYAKAGADEEKIRAAREKSQLAEKRAEEAVSHAEKMGNLADLKRAEDVLDQIRKDRIRFELAFQKERKTLQDEAYKSEIQRLKSAGEYVEKLLELLAELRDPRTAEGIWKGPEQLEADANRIKELAPEIAKAMEDAFDFDMFKKFGGTEAMDKIKTGIEDAFEKAHIDWTAVSNELQEEVSKKTYTVGVQIEITNQAVIDKYIERFGQIDPFGDPGQFGSRMEQVMEDIVQQYENLDTTIDQSLKGAETNFRNALKYIEKGAFLNPLQRMKGEWTENGVLVEILRSKIESLAKNLEATAKAGGTLTDEQRQAYASVVSLGQALQTTGELSNKNIMQGADAVKLLAQGMELLQKANQATIDQAELGEGAYEASLDGLNQQVQKQKEVSEAQKNITKEANNTETELREAKEQQVALPAAAIRAKETITQETTAARQLKTELQGAKEAQQELAQVTYGAVAAPAVDVTPLAKTKEELIAQTDAANKLTEALIKTDEQFNNVIDSINAVSENIIGPAQSASQIADSMSQASLATLNMNDAFLAVIDSLIVGIENVDILIMAVNESISAIDTAALATNSWTTSLHNCASAAYSAASAMRDAASAAKAAAAACASASAECAGGNVSPAYYGGPTVYYRQIGGSALRGMDRVPIMASAGEFIVSSKNARRFASQLQAMNAGREPVYRDRGGSITNIGDINVSVTGGETSQQTARDIAGALRREFRRGTSRLCDRFN